MKFLTDCLDRLKKLVATGSEDSGVHRIESARVTSSRLNALKRMRANSPTTPQYKQDEAIESTPTKKGNVDLDFGIEVRGL